MVGRSRSRNSGDIKLGYQSQLDNDWDNHWDNHWSMKTLQRFYLRPLWKTRSATRPVGLASLTWGWVLKATANAILGDGYWRPHLLWALPQYLHTLQIDIDVMGKMMRIHRGIFVLWGSRFSDPVSELKTMGDPQLNHSFQY